MLTGYIELANNSAIEFASGQITSIAAGATLRLDGGSSFIEDAGALGSNSALSSLATNAGSLSLENGAGFADYYSATVDEKGFLKDGFSRDGLHPNEKGYELMAPVAEAAIRKALN